MLSLNILAARKPSRFALVWCTSHRIPFPTF
jgi:hypothetical protein